jgi:hypothetical protein
MSKERSSKLAVRTKTVAGRTHPPQRAGTVHYKITAQSTNFGRVVQHIRTLRLVGAPHLRTGKTEELIVNDKLLDLVSELAKHGEFVHGPPTPSMLAPTPKLAPPPSRP